jgi:hypothetical protein
MVIFEIKHDDSSDRWENECIIFILGIPYFIETLVFFIRIL